jgi:hypothetical protein
MMEIYRDTDVPIRHKIWHIHKIGGKLHRDFTNDFGDVPVGNFNEITNCFERCINTRGNAYAARRRLSYRKKKGE